MNILLIVCDSLRQDYLSCYGNTWIRTPRIDSLARESVTFTNFFAASFPTGPMRRDLYSGRFTFPYLSWRDTWDPSHAVLPEILQKDGFQTGMITDTPSNSPHRRGFQQFELIEGQAGHGVEVEEGGAIDLPAEKRKLRVPLERLRRIKKVESTWKCEEDRFVARTMRRASCLLEKIHSLDDTFFLSVDTFDPHEPWNPPRYYIDQYDPGYEGQELFEPAYESSDYATSSEIKHMMFMYAGEVSLVDRWVGHLLDTLKGMGIYDETCIILTSDHGFYHGEHGFIGKVELDRENRITRRWPLYGTISHIPLIIRMPGLKPGSCPAFFQPPDLMPTILDAAGASIPETVQGISMLPVVRGNQRGREWAVSSHTYVQDREVRPPTSLRTSNYLYVYGGDECESEYFDLGNDPGEECNLMEWREEDARSAHGEFLSVLQDIDCPPENIRMRSKFRPIARSDLPLTRII